MSEGFEVIHSGAHESLHEVEAALDGVHERMCPVVDGLPFAIEWDIERHLLRQPLAVGLRVRPGCGSYAVLLIRVLAFAREPKSAVCVEEVARDRDDLG